MFLNLLLLVLAALLAAYVFQRLRRSKQADAEPETALESTSAFSAVAIRFEPDACDAAKRIAGERYLASKPPPIPLPECDAKICRCQFAHYDDRRRGGDRRSPFNPSSGVHGSGVYKTERRQGGDRRKSAGDD